MDKTQDFIKEYVLNPQSVMIHFQHGQCGATLRATEVKPKFDKFLIKKAKKDNVDIGGCFLSGTNSLNYKLRFIEIKRNDTVDLGFKTNYDIYYGNRKNDVNNKRGILSTVKMTVICFNGTLINLIDKYVGEFFVVTNFGTMSGKGFGSFLVEGFSFDDKMIASALKEMSGAKKCYCVSKGATPFVQIKEIYSTMKSGLPRKSKSILFEYLQKKNILNEKDWLKYDFVNTTKYRYTRALLGVCSSLSKVISVKHFSEKKEDKIDRLASPVFFKIAGDKIYIVAKRINECIFGTKFKFFNKNANKGGTIFVPTKKELGDNFIDEFMDYAIKKLNNSYEKNIREV